MAKKKNNNANNNKAADAAVSSIAQSNRKQSLGPAKSGAGAISKGEKVHTATAAATVIRGAKHAHKQNVGSCGCACDHKDEGRLHKVRELQARSQWARRYRVLKSLEMQQLRNRQKQLQAKLADAATTEEEKAGLHQQLDKVNEDILYITHYPSDQRYISVAATKPEAVAKRDAIRQKLLAEVGSKQSEDQNGAETQPSDETAQQETESKEEQQPVEASSAENEMAVVSPQEDKSEGEVEAKQSTETVAETPATTTQQTEAKPEAAAEPQSEKAEAAAEAEDVKLTKSQKKRLKKRRSAQKALAAAAVNEAAAPASTVTPTNDTSTATTPTEAPATATATATPSGEPMKVDDLQQAKADVAPQAEAETVAETITQEAQATTPVATKKRNRKASTPTKPSTPQKKSAQQQQQAQAPSKAPARKKTKAGQ